ncbi:LPXTG cell wall anchor domain-containing protein [Aerococcus sp. Group 2]|uniref:LPXTG cell wall anchor domain-containing protein n=1 Tax=Aerococcus sp. Group 2 TaxID=2976811 RepID=UPI00227AAA95|nr:LPXTG cell wall anchor domain-containing protein [Aerococcus sp. Group 2]MCY3035290.1 LPXTG cell wall anchor domain-containing protein [Aerococcus sp. Group 2]
MKDLKKLLLGLAATTAAAGVLFAADNAVADAAEKTETTRQSVNLPTEQDAQKIAARFEEKQQVVDGKQQVVNEKQQAVDAADAKVEKFVARKDAAHKAFDQAQQAEAAKLQAEAKKAHDAYAAAYDNPSIGKYSQELEQYKNKSDAANKKYQDYQAIDYYNTNEKTSPVSKLFWAYQAANDEVGVTRTYRAEAGQALEAAKQDLQKAVHDRDFLGKLLKSSNEKVYNETIAKLGLGKVEEPKPEEGKKDEVKKDEVKKDESKKDEVKKDESKKDEVKKDESKKDEVKKDESKKDESKKDESKKDESKKDESKKDKSKKDDKKKSDKDSKVVVANEKAKKDNKAKKDAKAQKANAKLPATGVVAGSVAGLGLALVAAGSALSFRRRK